MADDIFHPQFKARPYWWEDIAMGDDPVVPLPAKTDIAIVGGGYAGLNTALELARNGIDAVVLEAKELGFGASTRNGGAVSGGVSIGKGLSGKKANGSPEEIERKLGEMLENASDSFTHLESVIEREKIQCFYERRGRFVGAFTTKQFDALKARADALNAKADAQAFIVPRERQREEIASDYYYGGMVIERSGKLQPALYHRGLLEACRREGATLCAQTPVTRITPKQNGFTVETGRGSVEAREVVVATNGYTGDITPDLKRRVIPVASHIIATEPLDRDLAKSLIPKGRTINDTKRILTYYRMSPDGTRVVFGGRARFTQVTPEVSAPALYAMMVERWPQLKGVKLTHAWTGNVAFTFDYLPHMGRWKGIHYMMGCNGSGVAMMSYLGYQTARKIIGGANRVNAFDEREFPTQWGYTGDPWFLPIVGSYYRMRDRIDRWMS